MLDLLRHGAGSALAAFALVVVCAGMALALAIGVVSFMGGHAFGLVVLKRLALGLIAAGILGGIAWTQGDMRAVGSVVALLGGLGAWLVLNSNAFYVYAGYQMARRYMDRKKGLIHARTAPWPAYFVATCSGGTGFSQPPPIARIRPTAERACSPLSCTATRCCSSTLRSASITSR